MVEQEPEYNSGTSSEDRNTDVHPKNLRVDENGDQSLVERGAESVCEEVDTLHEGLHRRRSLGVSVLETSDRDENLSQADEDVRRGLDGDVDVVGERSLAVHAGWAGAWGVETGAS